MASEIIEDFASQTDNKTIKRKKLNINSIIKDLTSTTNVQVKNEVKFKLELTPNIYLIEGRYTDIYRIFMNLIVNSLEAIRAKGEIKISTKNLELPKNVGLEPKLFDTFPYIQISITDNGEGIDPSILPFIFDDNFSTKSKKKNHGIGLSFVKKIIEEYDGQIKVVSEKEKGTEFIIILPAVHNTSKQKNNSSDTKTILIAEDEEIQRQLLCELLGSYNYNIIAVSNGNAVLDKLKTDKLPDLLILDQKMPDMNGLTCIEKIKKLELNIPIILSSGSQGEIETEGKIKKYADRIINKPYNFDEMLNSIKELLR